MHGIFCGEQYGVAVRKDIWHILLVKLWSGCEEEYMAYFVLEIVEWL